MHVCAKVLEVFARDETRTPETTQDSGRAQDEEIEVRLSQQPNFQIPGTNRSEIFEFSTE